MMAPVEKQKCHASSSTLFFVIGFDVAASSICSGWEDRPAVHVRGRWLQRCPERYLCDVLRLADTVQPGMYGRIVFPGRDNGSPRTRCVTRIVQAVILARLCGGIKFGEDLAKMERRKVFPYFIALHNRAKTRSALVN